MYICRIHKNLNILTETITIMNTFIDKIKKLVDWAAIILGAVSIICNLTIDDNSICTKLYWIAAAVALCYIVYAGWLYILKRSDFDWHLINGHFLRKVVAIVILFPSMLTVAVSLNIKNPDHLFYDSVQPEYPDSTDVQQGSDDLKPSIFWSTYLHYINPGNPHMSSTAVGRVWAVFIGIFGIFLMGGLMVSSIVGWFGDRKKMWADGTIRYTLRFLGRNRFAVVIGANEIAASVIRNLFSSRKSREVNYKSRGKNDYVVLQTQRKVEEVRAELMSHLTEDELKKVIIYNALRDSEEEIEKLHLRHATEIYVLGESTLMDGGETYHDALNMSCVNLVAKELQKFRDVRQPQFDSINKVYDSIEGSITEIKKWIDSNIKSKTQESEGQTSVKADDKIKLFKRLYVARKLCKVMFDYQTTSSIFQFSDISQLIKDNLIFIPFNRYESWARKVIVEGTDGTFDYMPLEGSGFEKDSYEFAHLVIVGMSKMGIAMGVQALLQAHYLNSDKARTRITFIDTNADKEMAFFKGRYANMFELIRTRYIDTTAPLSSKIPVYSGYWKDPVAESGSKWAHLTENGKNFLDVEIEFIKGSLESDQVRECLKTITTDQNARVTIAMCLTFTHQAIAAALYMPVEVYKSDRLQQVWVYQRESDAIISALISDRKDLRYSKIRPFGMVYGEYMSDSSLYLKGLLVNYAYWVKDVTDKNAWPENIVDKGDPKSEEARELWRGLNVTQMWSNKYYADSIYTKIRNIITHTSLCGNIDCDVSGSDDKVCGNMMYSSQRSVKELLKLRYDETIDRIAKALEEHKEDLAVCEHNRWNIQQLLLGYSPCDKDLDDIFRKINKKSDPDVINKQYADWRERNLHSKHYSKIIKNDVKECALRIHPNICSFAHLDVVDKEAKPYDAKLNSAIPVIIDLVDGYGLKSEKNEK